MSLAELPGVAPGSPWFREVGNDACEKGECSLSSCSTSEHTSFVGDAVSTCADDDIYTTTPSEHTTVSPVGVSPREIKKAAFATRSGIRRPPMLHVPKAAASSTVDEVCGQHGNYVLGHVLGQGSSCRVYAAAGPEGAVALKYMHNVGEEFEHVLKSEFGILRSLSHPNIARVKEMGVHNNAGWIAMELFDGVTLTTAVHQGLLSTKAACAVLRQVASAVAYLHSEGICHRDVKPDNVLVNLQGDTPDVRLIDFNAAAISRGGFLSPVGALPFVAPEVREELTYDFPVDVWGLGAIAYFLLTKNFKQPRARFRELVWSDGLPAALRPMIAACLADEPEARPPADAIFAWLDEVEATTQ
jgi:serine/threonine protein kinase